MAVGAMLTKDPNRRFLLVLFAAVISTVFGQEAGQKQHSGRFIVQSGQPDIVYKGLLAAFGDTLEDDVTVNIVLPPNEEDTHMCEYPQWLNEPSEDVLSRVSNITEPVAILAAQGGDCSPEHKARIVLKMQKELSSNIKVLILYNTDYKFPNAYVKLKPDSHEAPEDLDSVAILHVPSRFVPTFQFQIGLEIADANPHFLQPGNEMWTFEHRIEGSWVATTSGYKDRDGNRISLGEDKKEKFVFSWQRFLAFTVIFISPCFGAICVFQFLKTGILIRRNENGRIVGFSFAAPPENTPHNEIEAPVTLTEEQFACLPTIKFKRHPELSCDSTEVRSATEHSESPADDIQTTENTATDADEEVASPRGVEQSISSKCEWSECSICIEELQPGDVLTVLPRCNHGFHRKCLRPWLLERFSRCPLCKADVLPDQAGDKGDDNV